MRWLLVVLSIAYTLFMSFITIIVIGLAITHDETLQVLSVVAIFAAVTGTIHGLGWVSQSWNIARGQNAAGNFDQLIEDVRQGRFVFGSNLDYLTQWLRSDKESVVKKLIKALDSPEQSVRVWSSHLLGQKGNTDATEALMARLVDNNEARAVRFGAAGSLGRNGDPNIIDRLLPMTSHPTDDVRYSVVVALSYFREPRIFEALLALVDDPATEVRAEAMSTLGEYRDVRAVIPLLRKLEDSEIVRVKAALSLATLGHAAGLDALISSLNSDNADVFEFAFDGLQAIKTPEAQAALDDWYKRYQQE